MFSVCFICIFHIKYSRTYGCFFCHFRSRLFNAHAFVCLSTSHDVSLRMPSDAINPELIRVPLSHTKASLLKPPKLQILQSMEYDNRMLERRLWEKSKLSMLVFKT